MSELIRGSPSLLGFPFILYLHTLGLALVAGLSGALALGVLYRREQVLRASYLKLFPLIWIGFAINVVSGLLLLVAYPAKAMTNPVFYIKLTAIAIGIWIVSWFGSELRAAAAAPDAAVLAARDAGRFRLAAGALLFVWFVATLTGRLLAYTHSMLLVGMY